VAEYGMSALSGGGSCCAVKDRRSDAVRKVADDIERGPIWRRGRITSRYTTAEIPVHVR
jgi:hypothetical protein